VPEIIDPVFAKTSQNARFLLSEYERFGLVFTKTRVYKFGHGSGVLELEVLVLELSSIDELVSGSVVVGEVTTLHCTASCGATIGSDYQNIVIGL
jgi:hypothetical protein